MLPARRSAEILKTSEHESLSSTDVRCIKQRAFCIVVGVGFYRRGRFPGPKLPPLSMPEAGVSSDGVLPDDEGLTIISASLLLGVSLRSARGAEDIMRRGFRRAALFVDC